MSAEFSFAPRPCLKLHSVPSLPFLILISNAFSRVFLLFALGQPGCAFLQHSPHLWLLFWHGSDIEAEACTGTRTGLWSLGHASVMSCTGKLLTAFRILIRKENWNQLTCLSHKRMDKLWYSHTMEYSSPVTRSKPRMGISSNGDESWTCWMKISQR